MLLAFEAAKHEFDLLRQPAQGPITVATLPGRIEDPAGAGEAHFTGNYVMLPMALSHDGGSLPRWCIA
ncbi:hypothetical protein AR457_40825 [Streptomyces agglomeratus]|nr:hypothetical protein AR457_40825 [Streptomyces agglomeratus]